MQHVSEAREAEGRIRELLAELPIKVAQIENS
jgi:hypothetical protein